MQTTDKDESILKPETIRAPANIEHIFSSGDQDDMWDFFISLLEIPLQEELRESS